MRDGVAVESRLLSEILVQHTLELKWTWILCQHRTTFMVVEIEIHTVKLRGRFFLHAEERRDAERTSSQREDDLSVANG